MVNLAKEMKDNDILLIAFGENYPRELINIIKKIEKQEGEICYVTLNKPYCTLIELFKKNKINIDKFRFIDCITLSVKKAETEKNCIFISAPYALTGINIAITEAIKSQNFKFLIFDSLSSLLIYEKMLHITEFIHSIINGLRIHKTKGIFIISKGDIDATEMKDLNMFVDKIVKI